MLRAARSLAVPCSGRDIRPVCADYTAAFRLPAFTQTAASVAAYFPGSTIGNFEPAEAVEFLGNVRRTCGPGSGLLVGVDLKKDPALLHAAYNDAAGVTAAFNLNLLARINRELGADFEPRRWRHYAFYNPALGRIEMHLVALAAHSVKLGEHRFAFAAGETIHTENSYKYSIEGFRELAAKAGFRSAKVWTDRRGLFALHALSA